jgi:hypothetical protein
MPALNAPLVGWVPEDGGGECRRPGPCPPLHPSSVQSRPLHYPLVDLHAITKASYYQVRCVDDTTGGGGSLKTVEGSAGGLASVLLSTLLLSSAGLVTICSWTSMPSLKLLITRLNVWTAPLVGRLPEDSGGECRRRGLCPPLHPTSVQSRPLHYPLLDLHAITKASYYQAQCVDGTTGGVGP